MKTAYRNRLGFVIALLVPLMILGGIAFKPLLAKAQGNEILLATDAYDPRDLFRGDYVHLNLEISRASHDRLSKEIFNGGGKYNNSFVYVLLKPDERGYYSISSILSKPPSQGLYLKARISGLREKSESAKPYHVYLHYGLERYYVQENTGQDLQYDSNDGALDVRVKVYEGYGYVAGLDKRK